MIPNDQKINFIYLNNVKIAKLASQIKQQNAKFVLGEKNGLVLV